LPNLSSGAHDDDRDTHGAASSLGLQLSLGLALPAAIGLAVLAHPIVALLYERGAFNATDTTATALALALLAAALPAHALIKACGSLFFARERMAVPALTTIAGLAVTFITAWLAQPRFGHAGVAAAIATGAWLTALTLAIVLAVTRELPIDGRGARMLALIALASAIMGAALIAAEAAMPDAGAGWLSRALNLATLIALGLFVYVGALLLFGVLSFRLIRKAFGQAR